MIRRDIFLQFIFWLLLSLQLPQTLIYSLFAILPGVVTPTPLNMRILWALVTLYCILCLGGSVALIARRTYSLQRPKLTITALVLCLSPGLLLFIAILLGVLFIGVSPEGTMTIVGAVILGSLAGIALLLTLLIRQQRATS